MASFIVIFLNQSILVLLVLGLLFYNQYMMMMMMMMMMMTELADIGTRVDEHNRYNYKYSQYN